MLAPVRTKKHEPRGFVERVLWVLFGDRVEEPTNEWDDPPGFGLEKSEAETEAWREARRRSGFVGHINPLGDGRRHDSTGWTR